MTDILTIPELASVFGVSERTMYRWFKADDPPHSCWRMKRRRRGHKRWSSVLCVAWWLSVHPCYYITRCLTGAQQQHIHRLISEQRRREWTDGDPAEVKEYKRIGYTARKVYV